MMKAPLIAHQISGLHRKCGVSSGSSKPSSYELPSKVIHTSWRFGPTYI